MGYLETALAIWASYDPSMRLVEGEIAGSQEIGERRRRKSPSSTPGPPLLPDLPPVELHLYFASAILQDRAARAGGVWTDPEHADIDWDRDIRDLIL